uniref:Uncharacterized protein n=1 Tax=Caenorhabditis japonica TaxID=281687 RepID=A0A8R1EHL9_CAEJA
MLVDGNAILFNDNSGWDRIEWFLMGEKIGRGWLFQQDNTFEKHNSQKLYREVRETQGRMDQNPTSDPDELDRVHAKKMRGRYQSQSHGD